jgi:hypothetical protein
MFSRARDSQMFSPRLWLIFSVSFEVKKKNLMKSNLYIFFFCIPLFGVIFKRHWLKLSTQNISPIYNYRTFTF